MRKTKIICTLGPSTDNPEILKELILNGMNVARFNFSHGDHKEQKARLDLVKQVREELGIPVATLLDTKGPEIRTGKLKDGKKVTLEEGQKFVLSTKEMIGDSKGCSITYADLTEDVKEGDHILIDDGLIELQVNQVEGSEIDCTVLNGGELGEKKGVNVPNVKINLPGITDKDRQDIIFGIEQGFDFIAASFVRNVDAVLEIREILQEYSCMDMKVIAKIENQEGIDNIDAIIKGCDGIMVARGDLGVEIPAEEVPHLQKMIIRKCNDNFKTVITATQMLDSMIRNPRPTRAEVGDVANAIYDGTDVVMLSGETAAGKYPIEAVKMMANIAESTEARLDYEHIMNRVRKYRRRGISSAVSYATVATAYHMNARCIVTPTMSGYTARIVSKFKPSCDVIATSPSESVLRKMMIYWGVTPLLTKEESKEDNIIEGAIKVIEEAEIKGEKIVESGDIVVITAGVGREKSAVKLRGVTNDMRVISIN
ncbi:Pyruvate kinase [Lachnospiraceae bacterium TWA4]|nr:Pyruvate kinase [Lachnospiraceae bacterium TWA4]